MVVVLKDFVSWDLNFASGPVIFAVVVVDFVILPCERSKEWSRKCHQEKKQREWHGTVMEKLVTLISRIMLISNVYSGYPKKPFCCVVDMLIYDLSCVELP